MTIEDDTLAKQNWVRDLIRFFFFFVFFLKIYGKRVLCFVRFTTLFAHLTVPDKSSINRTKWKGIG